MRWLRIALLVQALTFLTAAALNFGARIPLGIATLQFPLRIIPAGAGEAIIGAALLVAAVTMSRAWAWIGFWLSAGGIAFGLVATSRSGNPAFDVHLVMAALAIVVLALLLGTRQPSDSAPAAPAPPSGLIALMLVAAATLLGASAIHFGLTAPVLYDPFGAAAIPEAVLGAILLAGALGLLSRRPGAWEAAVACAVLTTLLTLYGFTVTLRTGRPGDIAYHLTLLAMLFATVGLLLSPAIKRLPRAV